MSDERDDVTVLVTGVGAVIGQGIVRSLRSSGRPFRIVGLDKNPLALGKRDCDAFHPKPDVDEGSAAYADFLRDVLLAEQVGLVLPGIEHDVFWFDAHRGGFDDTGATIVLNQPELIALGSDKWLMHGALEAAGLPTIPTTISNDWADCRAVLGDPPYLFKPRRGSGSRGQARVDDAEDLAYLARKNGSNFMLQAYVGTAEEEYTVGIFGLGDGNATAPAILRRTLGPVGATWTAETVLHDSVIEAFSDRLTRHFCPLGPTNYQFRKAGERIWLLEINPRFSSSTSLRTAFGFNEALLAVQHCVDGRSPVFAGLREGRASRYIEDHVELRC